jgi:hypothetical protein
VKSRPIELAWVDACSLEMGTEEEGEVQYDNVLIIHRSEASVGHSERI